MGLNNPHNFNVWPGCDKLSLESIKNMVLIFFILFGAGFLVAAILTEGDKVGKFSKPFCLIFGSLVFGISAYLY